MKHLFLGIAIFIFLTGNIFAQTQTPGLDILGYGYDVFGDYADQASKKKYCLFNYSNFKTVNGITEYTAPQYVILERMSKHKIGSIKGESIRAYIKDQSASAGLDVEGMCFSSSVNASFGKSSSSSERNYYYTYRDANAKWRISFDERDLQKLKEILDTQFKEDLAEMEPAKLFDLYGTHYIASAYLGGRADFSSVSVITSNVKTSDIAVAVEASYKIVSANASISEKHQQTLSNAKTITKLTFTGGNSEYPNDMSNQNAYKLWADGIAETPVLCDFDENSLKPIWDFCENAERKSILIAEFEKMLKAHPLPAVKVNLGTEAYLIKNKANNLYWDFEGFSSDAEKSKAELNLAAKDKGGQGFDRIFKVSALNENDPQAVYFQPQHCDLVLVITDGSKEPNATFQLAGFNAGFKSQKYILEPVEEAINEFRIMVQYTGLYLTAKSGKVIQTKLSESDAQIWIFENFNPKDIAPPKTAFYAVKSMAVDQYWDFAGTYPNVSGSELISWKMGKQEGDRVYKFAQLPNTNDYLIRPGHEKSRVLTARELDQQLFVFDQKRSDNQLFNFEYGGSPNSYIIVHKGTGYVITLRKDRTQMNGAEINISEKIPGATYQQWNLKFHK